MNINALPDMVGRHVEWERLGEFAASGEPTATLGIVWGRRRVGKSFLLQSLSEQTGGFHYEAVRGASSEALRSFGERIGAYQKAAAPLAFDSWDQVIEALMTLGKERETVVVLDEFPYLLEHSPEIESIIQRAFGPRNPLRTTSQTRLILCGSAMSVMGKVLGGTAPLRGRAGLDLRISPFDYRVARELHGIDDLATAVRTYAVIGGVAAYAREMSENDVPAGPDDFDRWICRRVLSPAAPLFNEIQFMLSEDPATSKARKLNLYHAALAGVASGNHTWSSLTSYLRISGASLNPIMDALIGAEFVARINDPIRDNRAIYQPVDQMLRFHYALLRRHAERLSRHGADTRGIWRDLEPTFQAQVLGPCFESMARFWTTHFAARETLGGAPEHVGPTTLTLGDGRESEIDVVVAADDGATPTQRTVHALGEAKVGQEFSLRHVERLEAARTALGPRAANAKLLMFGSAFDETVRDAVGTRADLEIIDLSRLYAGV